jgi:hypothetical protein
MGLTGGWRDNEFGFSKFAVLFGTWFASSTLYALFALGIRGTQFFSPIPGLELMPAIATAFAFLLASRPFANAHGGVIYHMQMAMTLLVGWVLGRFSRPFFKRIHKMADENWKKLNFVRLIIASFAMFLGTFFAVFLVWLVVGDFAVFIPHSPGPFPGFSPPGFEPLLAFAAEAIFAGALGIVLTYFALVGGVNSETGAPDSSVYHNGLYVATFGVAASVAIGYNISGTCLDLAIWAAEHTMVGIVLGQTPFTAAPFANIGDYWWVYVFGNMLGWFIGVLVGYLLAGLRVRAYDELTPEEEQVLMEEEPAAGGGGFNKRIGAKRGNSTRVGAGQTPKARTAAEVDQLAIAGGLFASNQ